VEVKTWRGSYHLPLFHLRIAQDCLAEPVVEGRKDANLLLVKQEEDVAETNFKGGERR